MGALCCCLKSRNFEESQVELNKREETNSSVSCKCGLFGQNIKLSKNEEKGTYLVEGSGTAIGSCQLDCDTAYFEVRIGKNPADVKIGLAKYNKKNGSIDFNETLDKLKESWYMQGVELKEGDVVGVYWDQTDLPMVKFTLNGEESVISSINRIRPAQDVYPAVSIINGSAEMIFDDKHFVYPPKSKKFSMIVCATSLI